MIHLIADSSCDLHTGELDSPHVRLTVIPMCLRVGEQDYPDTAELSVPHLLRQMATHSTASTACPSPAAFAAAFAQEDESICITISSNLSGTYNAAVSAREIVMSEHPEKKIFVLDSRATSGSMILLLRQAARWAAEGLAFETICRRLEDYRRTQRLCFTLENFDNLIKNGRMRPITGHLLHTLGIRIIAEATAEGTIRVSKKIRGLRQTLRGILQVMRSAKDCGGIQVIVSHCQNSEMAQSLQALIAREIPSAAVELRPCRGLTSFYAMEKGLIVSY